MSRPQKFIVEFRAESVELAAYREGFEALKRTLEEGVRLLSVTVERD